MFMLFKIEKRKEQLIFKTGVVDWVNCVKYDCLKYDCLKISLPKSRPFKVIFAMFNSNKE